jgi:small subunit ribosomal protein S1
MDDTKTFAEMFEESYATPKRFAVGEKVEATIVKISPEWIFIDLGAKSEGYMDKKEFFDDAGNLTVKEGDTVTAYFLSSRHSERLFTTKLLARKSVDEFLINAYQNGIPLEAVVEKEIKGGFSVKISASASGFCPYSQMDKRKIDNAGDYVGKKFDFIVIEYGENGRNVILSRRPLLDKIEQEKKSALKDSLQKGMTVKGVVTSVRDFGAFVDIGGVQALLPVSEMTWGRVENTSALYKTGDAIEAVIINLDWENDRVTLSFKDTLPDPWNDVVRNYVEGSIHKGRVSRLTDFGAFITLEAGVDGLLHISKLGKGKKIKHAQDVLSRDREIDVKIEKIDRDNKRISLDLASTSEDKKGSAEEKDDYQSYLPKAPTTMGTFGDLMKKSKKK